MKTMKYRYIIMIAALIGVFSASAFSQEEINQEVKIVKAYTPTISDAYKVNYMPVLGDTATLKPSFNYRILSTSVATNYQPTPISPAKINLNRKEHLQKSYLKGGVGNYSSIVAELGYNILENDKYVLGFNVGHITSLGELTLEDDNSVDAPFHDTWASANFKHFFDDKTFSVDLGFLHNKFQYYGFQTLQSDAMYYLPDATLTNGSDFIPDVDQRMSAFDIRLGLSNNETDKRKTAYDTWLGFKTFGNVTGVKQNGFIFGGDLYRPINDLAFELTANIESYKTSVPDTIGPMYTFADRSLTLIQLKPSVSFNLDKARLKVGVLMAGVIDSHGDEFYVTPDIMGELTVVEGIVTVYGGINGKVDLNDYQSMSYENPFASADVNVKSSLYGLNFLAGIKGNFSSSTSFSIGMEYGLFNDEHFWVNKPYMMQGTTPGVDDELHYSNQFDVVYDDGSLLTVEGELLYQPKQNMEFSLFGAYYGWNLDSQKAAWHMPELEIGAEGKFNILDNLYATAGIKLLGERMAFDPNADNYQKSLKSVVDLNASAEYYFSKQWSFWLAMNNLAAAKYYKWNGYPMQGFNAKAGIIFSF